MGRVHGGPTVLLFSIPYLLLHDKQSVTPCMPTRIPGDPQSGADLERRNSAPPIDFVVPPLKRFVKALLPSPTTSLPSHWPGGSTKWSLRQRLGQGA